VRPAAQAWHARYPSSPDGADARPGRSGRRGGQGWPWTAGRRPPVPGTDRRSAVTSTMRPTCPGP
jgi:hypothetical protein